MSCFTPVEDSLCCTKTARIFGLASSAAFTASGFTAAPHSASRTWTSMPWALPMLAQRSPKLPATRASMVSPLHRVFTRAASIPPLPEQERISTSCEVFKKR